MSGIPLTRCQFLIPFADIHNEIGAPTTALLTKFRLPTSLEEKADHYAPMLSMIQFAEAAQRSQGLTDFGFLASQRLQFCHLSEKLRSLITYSPTLFIALQQLCKWAPFEDTILQMWLEHHGDHIRICSKLAGTEGLRHLEHSQWLQHVLSTHIVRQFVGPGWMPATIAFEARYRPSRETKASWPHTQFLSAQDASWIDVPASLLSLPNLTNEPLPNPPEDEPGPSGNNIINSLKLLLPSYLDGGPPTIVEMAEMAGMSLRSLQRKLAGAGLTYSDMLDCARFEHASKLLRGTEAKIIDIALSSGYADPSHFARAFRRISGVTPREFRDTGRPR
ncbi:helix-turn-helix domain-containing protein [Bradyrhizobium sp. Arg62]|uniref:AraC family transcriptional regulator n=1 Tax=Bradyrhizobium brasilense TaxID=1419277 RepID=UPI001E3FE34C|nr:AraC family transcriptional regulator [Bradyrhizobium brasilense]MCC8943598.1 helix-turn-helix domain-containing protein [Bradyrhizobium brasilense]